MATLSGIITPTNLVTATSTTTLTNKTVALASNTVSGTIAQFNTALTDGDFATGGGTATGTNTGDNAANTSSQPIDAALTALAGGSDFVQFTGPATSTKVFTLPDTSSTLLVSGGALGTPSSGTLSNATGLPAAGVVGTAAIIGANTFTGAQEWATGTAIASASTINLNTATGNRVHITGTTAITAVTLTRGPRTVIFDGILTLTHNATTNNLPGAANITTAAGDRAIYEGDGTTVYCVSYIRVATTGTGSTVLSTSPTLVTPALGTPASGTLTNATGLPLSTGVTGTLSVASGGTGVTTSTGTGSTVLSTSPTLVTPALGTPASGILSSCTVDGTDKVGFLNIPQNSQSAAYTLVLADAGKHIFHPSGDATARTYTIPANSSVPYTIGTAITFINMTAAVVTIAITTDTMYLSSAGTTGSRSLAQYGSATAIKMTSTTWLISGSGLT